jgi:hypothetical protein
MNTYIWEVEFAIDNGKDQRLYTKRPQTNSKKPCVSDVVKKLFSFYEVQGVEINITSIRLLHRLDDDM